MKKIILGILTFICIITLCSGCEEMYPEYEWKDFDNKELKNNTEKAFKKVNLDTSKIKTVQPWDEWDNGPLYKIQYEETTYYIYAYDDAQIGSIKKDSLVGDIIYNNDNLEFKDSDGDSSVSIITYGQMGDYGKTVIYDGKEYIHYFLPEGEYEVKALVKNAMFFIVGTQIYKNSSGHDESETIDTIKLSNKGDKTTITLNSNSCIDLVMFTSISIKKIN